VEKSVNGIRIVRPNGVDVIGIDQEPRQLKEYLYMNNSRDYKFGKIIGEGSFSMVYIARDEQTHNEYASKYFLLS